MNLEALELMNSALTLADFGNFVDDRIPNSYLDKSSYIGNDNLLSEFQGVINSDYVPSNGSSSRFLPNDILIGNIRPYLKKMWLAKFSGGASNDVLVFRCTDPSEAEFVFLALTSQDFIDFSMAGSKGTKMPRGEKTHILKYKLPPLSQDLRTRTSTFFSTVNSRIENNLAICRELEKIGREFYKLSKTDLAYLHESKKYKLGDVLVRNSKRINLGSEVRTIDLSVMPEGSLVLFNTNSSNNFDTNLFELNKGDLLIGAIRPYLRKFGIAPLDGAVTGTVLSYSVQQEDMAAFLLFLLDSEDFREYLIKMSYGTKMPVVDSDIVLNFEFEVSDETLNIFSQKYDYRKHLITLVSENLELRKLVNRFLPLALSGSILF